MSARLPVALVRRGPAVALVALLAAVALAFASALGSGAHAAATYRVDAIFDTAKGIIPGQLLKIGGARAGTVKAVHVTPDYKARIELEIDQNFAPFRADASCEIKPEGLISENFVQCNPGTPNSGPLKTASTGTPTVPVEHTSLPVNLSDLFQAFSTPVRQRFSVIIAGLGLGLSSRGPELNAILRRANPALTQARRAIAVLSAQRRQLSVAITAADKVAAELARRPVAIGNFVDNAAKTTDQTAQHRAALELAVKRLPGLLDAARPALLRLDEVAAAGAPVLNDLRGAAPQILSLTRELQPFSKAADPAIRSLGAATIPGRRAARDGRKPLANLRRLADTATPAAQNAVSLFTNLRDSGSIENLLKFFYYGAAGTARYDSISHILPAHVSLSNCSMFATTPTPGCSANFGGASAATASTPAAGRSSVRIPSGSSATSVPVGRSPGTPGEATVAPSTPVGSLLGIVKKVLGGLAPQGQQQQGLGLLDYLLK